MTEPAENPGTFIAPTPEELHQLIPQLEVQELLACGGMGAVYRALQPNLDRTVALKILPPSVGQDPAYAEQFRREAKAMAQLNHPNVVGIFDFGQAGQYFYFVMEHVDGPTLHDLVHPPEGCEAISQDKAIDLFGQVCDGLAFAHAKGIVHLDVKPGNVMVDSDGVAKLLDFGLASLRDAGRGEEGDASAEIMGTPDYAAPERFVEGATVDHRADIFSLGVMFYEMLTGTVLKAGYEPASKVAGSPVSIDPIITRCIRTEAEKRFSDVGELSAHLEKARRMRGSAPPVLAAAGAGTATTAAAPARKSGGGLLTLAGLLAVALFGGGIWFVTQRLGQTNTTPPELASVPPTAELENLLSSGATPESTGEETAGTETGPDAEPNGDTVATADSDTGMEVTVDDSLENQKGPIDTDRLLLIRRNLQDAETGQAEAIHQATRKALINRYTGALEELQQQSGAADPETALLVRKELLRIELEGTAPETLSTHPQVARHQETFRREFTKLAAEKTARIQEARAEAKAAALDLRRTYSQQGRTRPRRGVDAFLEELESPGSTDRPPATSEMVAVQPSAVVEPAPKSVRPILPNASLSRVKRLTSHEGRVAALALSPNDQFLVSGGNDGTVKVWLAKEGTLLRTMPAGPEIHSLSISGDGKFLACSTHKHGVYAWPMSAPQPTRHHVLPGGGTLADLVFSEDPLYVYVARHFGDGRSEVVLLNLATGEVSARYPVNVSKAQFLSLAPGGLYMAVSSRKGGIAVIALKDGKEVWQQAKPVGAAEYSPDSRFLYVGGRTVDPLTGELLSDPDEKAPGFWSSCIAATGDLYLVGADNGKVFLRDGQSSLTISSPDAHRGGCADIVASRYGKRVYTCGADASIGVWELQRR